jgi:hypothetical protein
MKTCFIKLTFTTPDNYVPFVVTMVLTLSTFPIKFKLLKSVNKIFKPNSKSKYPNGTQPINAFVIQYEYQTKNQVKCNIWEWKLLYLLPL